MWIAYDGQTLTADIKVRPSGMPEYDAAVAERFGTLSSWRESIELLKQILPEEQLADSEGICAG